MKGLILFPNQETDMTNETNLGKFLSVHKRGGKAAGGLYGCGMLLIVPLACGAWVLYAALTTDQPNEESQMALILAIILIVASVVILALFLLLAKMSPAWLNRYKVEIHENGFKLTTFFKSQTCLWSEIATVNPMLLTTPANRTAPSPLEFHEFGDTRQGGIYEVDKKDGTRILISRQYSDIEKIDDALTPFCKEQPRW